MNIINAGNRIMNVYVYRAPIGRVMIDTGYENGLKRVEKKLTSFNVPMAEIKYVFLTHEQNPDLDGKHTGISNVMAAVDCRRCQDAAAVTRNSVSKERLGKIHPCHIEDSFEKAMTCSTGKPVWSDCRTVECRNNMTE